MNVLSEELRKYENIDLGQSTHLNQRYTFFRKILKICVMDLEGNINSRIYQTRILPFWRGSALLLASPNRVGFIGRDILHDFQIILQLDSTRYVSRIINLE